MDIIKIVKYYPIERIGRDCFGKSKCLSDLWLKYGKHLVASNDPGDMVYIGRIFNVTYFGGTGISGAVGAVYIVRNIRK